MGVWRWSREGVRVSFRASLAAAAVALTGGWALAQPQPTGPSEGAAPAGRDENQLTRVISNLFLTLTSESRDKVFRFIDTVELLNVEAEVDRLAGNPWTLHDSTEYKLRLLPLYIAYPVHRQLVQRMTRQDELRGLRIYNVSPEAVEGQALRLGALTSDRLPDDFAAQLFEDFSGREIVDLGVYLLSRQPFFPDTDEGWQAQKRRLGRHKGALITTAVLAGAAFDAGAYSQSGTFGRHGPDDFRLGWYGGVRRVGFGLRPQARGGLTLRGKSLEIAAGLSEHVRPTADDRRRSVELALREGWVERLFSPRGWDAFLECALRQALSVEPLYAGERTTGRAGLFVKRPSPGGLRSLVFRGSGEAESDFDQSLRFVSGIGLEHTETGLAAVLQSSRTRVVRDGKRLPDTQTGLFVAGTLEPASQLYVVTMQIRARLVQDLWDEILVLGARRKQAERRLRAAVTARLPDRERLAAADALGRALAAVDEHTAELADRLGDYLESRRAAYAVLRRPAVDDDLQGPLDGSVLRAARRTVLDRLDELAAALEPAPPPLEEIRDRWFELREVLDRGGLPDAVAHSYRAQLGHLDRRWREESERVGAALDEYLQLRDGAERMAEASRIKPAHDPDPLGHRTMRRLVFLVGGRTRLAGQGVGAPSPG